MVCQIVPSYCSFECIVYCWSWSEVVGQPYCRINLGAATDLCSRATAGTLEMLIWTYYLIFTADFFKFLCWMTCKQTSPHSQWSHRLSGCISPFTTCLLKRLISFCFISLLYADIIKSHSDTEAIIPGESLTPTLEWVTDFSLTRHWITHSYITCNVNHSFLYNMQRERSVTLCYKISTPR